MKMNVPTLALKVIVAVHFILTIWASTSGAFLPLAYTYMNIGLLMFGAFCIALPESTETVLMFLVLHIFSIFQDIVFLGIYHPSAHTTWEENPKTSATFRNTFRFSLGMCITNLIIKPVTAFIIFRVYQDRGGDFSFVKVPSLPHFGRSNQYDDIDQSTPANEVETASPHHKTHEPEA